MTAANVRPDSTAVDDAAVPGEFACQAPARADRPALAILAALPAAPLRPPAGSMLNVLFEVSRDPKGWTLIPAEQLAGSRSERMLQVPLDPPVTIDGHIVTALATPEPCVASYVAAFADERGSP